MADRHPPIRGPVTLVGSRIYILPTYQGCLFGALLFVLFLGSLNYQNSLSFMLTFTLAGIGLISMWHTQRNVVGLQIVMGSAQSTFVGNHAHVDLRLGGERRGHFDLRLSFAGGGPTVAVDIAAGSAREVDLAVPALRRGYLRPGRLLIASRYPLGLFRAWTWVNNPIDVLIYPKPSGNSALPNSGSGELQTGSMKGDYEEEFESLRPYRLGDPPRQIAWKASARGAGMHSKQFRGTTAEALCLQWPAGISDLERGLSQLCLWVIEASRRELRYGLKLDGLSVPPGLGKQHRRRCLEALACYQPSLD